MSMNLAYYYLALVNAVVSLAVAVAVFWKNRHQSVGPLFATTMIVNALWLVGFAHYFLPLPPTHAMGWAKLTLAMSILTQPFLFHSMCALVEQQSRRWRWIFGAYAATAMFLILLGRGHLITGLRPVANMNHYVAYNRALYPLLGALYLYCQWGGAALLIYNARLAAGYKRSQLVYFIVAWGIVFLTTNSIIIPLEYGLSIQPFGFFILPLNMAFLAYVMAKARLADFNVVIARVLLYAVALLVVVGISLLAVGIMTQVAPDFMTPPQILFSVMLSGAIGAVLLIGLPRFLPRVERMMQERIFAGRVTYQNALSSMSKELTLSPNVNDLLKNVAIRIHTQMQLTRVLIFMQDPLSGQYRLSAESGLLLDELTEDLVLADDAAVIHWLRDHRDVLVLDEIVRTSPAVEAQDLTGRLKRLHSVVAIPMFAEEQLVGVFCLGAKINREMYYPGDLTLLEKLGAEVALAVKYRWMEEQISRKNKLIELGTIAAGVAHEVRNPLASIRTFAQLLPSKMDDPEFTGEFSKLVLKDVDRITKVIESMLAFARPAQVTIREHKAVDLLEEAILLVQTHFKNKHVELVKEFHEEPTVRVDKQQIVQVLVNLLSNAVDASPERGRIRVAIGIHSMNANGAASERYAVIEVSDNGSGIPAPVLNRIFDPFFTTKKEGTGLGLSISQKIARDHGGIITVSSVEGKGTTFQVNLPVS